jgi:adenylate cyclase
MTYRTIVSLQAIGCACLACLVLGLVCLLAPEQTLHRWREWGVDRLISPSTDLSDRIVVVDIDEKSLEAIGPWPWPRDRLTALINRIVSDVPQVLGVEILLAGPDRYSPAAMAASLRTLDPQLRAQLEALADPDAALALAVSSTPTVLSGLFADARSFEFQPVPLLVSGEPGGLLPWAAPGGAGPLDQLAQRANAVAIASMAGDSAGIVRQVPLLGLAGDTVVSGFAAEVLRQSQAASAVILNAQSGTLGIGDYQLPLVGDVSLRFRASGPTIWNSRTISAASVLDGSAGAGRFEGRIVLLGGSAPQLGALRATAASPLAPSIQIQADALQTILSGSIPYRPSLAGWAEVAGFVVLGLAGAAAGALLGPLIAGLLALALCLSWLAAASVSVRSSGLVFDPLTPAIACLLAVLVAGVFAAMIQRRLAGSIRRRFEQHLAPAIVARIVERPDLVRFEGERRVVTALFTDIEGFTSLTDRLGPRDLIALLDEYFAGVTAAIVRHGGMIDKFVGDAVHAFFNAPVDLPDHPAHAYAAARDIIEFTEGFQASKRARAAGLGRTRIGIETGEVVIGDVGSGIKVDYTAYGSAVNTAARLEALNKNFGTSICVGPEFQAHFTPGTFRLLGEIDVRGRGLMNVYTPSV